VSDTISSDDSQDPTSALHLERVAVLPLTPIGYNSSSCTEQEMMEILMLLLEGFVKNTFVPDVLTLAVIHAAARAKKRKLSNAETICRTFMEWAKNRQQDSPLSSMF